MRSRQPTGLLAAALFWAGPAAIADNAALNELLQDLDEIRVESRVAGMGLILIEGDRVLWSGGRGLASRESGAAMTGDTLVRIGSVTKVFTGLAMLAAQGHGLVDLDAPVASMVDDPPFENPWADEHPVTLAQLLEHSAGLRDMSPKEFDFNQPVSLEKALTVDPDSRRLAWPPGLHSSYSNSGAGVAAFVFEQVTGRAFEPFVHEVVFRRLSMPTASFRPPPDRELAAGYDSDGVSPIKYWHQLYRPFGAINVRLGEMAQVVRLFLGRGRLDGEQVFSEAEIRRLETPQTTLAARSGLEFGYGFGNYAYVHDGFEFHGHGGDADGYLCFYGYNLDTGRGYFVLINAFQGRTLRRMRAHIESYLVRDAQPHFVPPTPQPVERLKALAGTYSQVTHRFGDRRRDLQVAFRDNRLWLERDGDMEVLLPMEGGHFRRRYEPVATTAFVHHEGRLYLQGPFGNYVRNPQ